MILAVLVEQVGPYHAARLGALASLVGRESTRAIVMAVRSDRYAWRSVDRGDFRATTLFPEASYESIAPRRLRRAVVHELDRSGADVVAVNGWGFVEARAAIGWAARRGASVVLMSDSQAPGGRPSGWREAGKRAYVLGCGAAFVAGSRHAEYVARLGMPPDRIVQGYDVVDAAHFAARPGDAEGDGHARRHFLCSARFIPEKNLLRLLAEYARYAATVGDSAWDLVLIGDGPLRQSLEAEVRRCNLEARVKLKGFLQYDDLPKAYRAASALVLPSVSETWGLVVNEAMASGLPVLVSNACGCAPELVREGENGWTFDPRRSGELARLFARLSALSSGELAEMGSASERLIADYTPRSWAEGLLRAATLARSHPARGFWKLARWLP